LIEDDRPIAELIRGTLQAARFETDLETDGEAGLRAALNGSYALVVLDLMLPGRDGWSICRALRMRRNHVPILMLTARDGLDDRIQGLEAGADDYLPKPFDFQELVARVRSLTRRESVHRTRVIEIADLRIDTVAGLVTRSGEEVPLTPREYTLLEALAMHEGRLLSRETIMERVWMDETSCSNIVNVHMVSLRRKIDGDHPVKLLHTVRSKGYLLRGPDLELS
jgi:two-component system copper resistance phosphate regulon response regulator CusR